jgi:nucleoside-triphosphatase THEP1
MNRIILITGEKNSGKTTFLKYFIHHVIKKRNLIPAGFIAEGIFVSGEKRGFDLIGLVDGKKKTLCTDIPRMDWLNRGKFFFDPEGFRFGEEQLAMISENSCPVIIDEFGLLEMSGAGWRNAVERLLDKTNLTLMITVRKEILARAIDIFSGHELHVFDVNKTTHAALSDEIAKLMPS